MDRTKFALFLSSLRKEKGWTQDELAKRLNVTNKAVSKWERGAGFPDVQLLESLADALDVSVLELIHGERMSEQAIPLENAEAAVSDVIKAAASQKEDERSRKKNFWFSLLLFAAGILLMLNATKLGENYAASVLRARGGTDIDVYSIFLLSCSSNFRAIGFAVCIFSIFKPKEKRPLL